MAVKDVTGKDLVELMLKPNWKHGQVGLVLNLAPSAGAVVMSVPYVDELIGELIQMRDMMERLNETSGKESGPGELLEQSPDPKAMKKRIQVNTQAAG